MQKTKTKMFSFHNLIGNFIKQLFAQINLNIIKIHKDIGEWSEPLLNESFLLTEY